MTLNSVTVNWTAEDLSAAAVGGNISFQPSVFLTAPADSLIIGQEQKTYHFLAGATGTATVYATDNGDIAQAGWWYNVTVQLDGAPSYQFSTFIAHANGGTQNFASLVPVVPSANYAAYLPLHYPTGAAANYVWTSDGFGNGSWQAQAANSAVYPGFNVVTYGADPTGVADSCTAFQNAINAAIAGVGLGADLVSVPPGTYTLNSASISITGPFKMQGWGSALANQSGSSSPSPGVILNCNGGSGGANNMFTFPYQGYLWGGLEVAGFAINYTGTGNVYHQVNFTDSVFRDKLITLSAAGSQAYFCSGSVSFLNVLHERVNIVTTAATRSNPMVNISSTLSGSISNNTFFKCKFSNNGFDNTQFAVVFACNATGMAYHYADNMIDCWFEHPYGGAYKSLSGMNIKVDGCSIWDIFSGSGGTVAAEGLFYFGAGSGPTSGSQGVRVVGTGRNQAGPNGSSTWDIYCEATTSQVEIEGYAVKTPTASTTSDAYFNFNGCNDVTLINNQSPQGSTVNGNSTTVVTNPSPTQITLSAGVIALTSNKVTGLANGTASSDAAAFGQIGTAVATETTRAETAEGLLAPKASPALTGVPTAPTAAALTDSTQLATTAYADTAVGVELARAEAAEALLAPKASPALTGSPTAPTQTTGDSSTKIATDAFVATAVGVETTRAEAAEVLLAPLVSPALTGTPTGTTAGALTNSTRLATTAYADSAVGVETTRAETAEALKVVSVTAGDASIVVGGTATAPTLETATLDEIASLHAPVASVGMNSQKLTNLLFGTGLNDGAAFGQLPQVPATMAQLGMVAWTYPSLWATATTPVLTSGVVYLMRIPLYGASITATNIWMGVGTAGATLTASECWAGLFDNNGNQIGITAQQATSWQTAGVKDVPLVGGPYVGTWPWIFAAIVSNGTTNPAFERAGGANAGSGMVYLNATGSNMPIACNGTGATVLPGSFTYSANQSTSNPQSIWVGIS